MLQLKLQRRFPHVQRFTRAFHSTAHTPPLLHCKTIRMRVRCSPTARISTLLLSMPLVVKLSIRTPSQKSQMHTDLQRSETSLQLPLCSSVWQPTRAITSARLRRCTRTIVSRGRTGFLTGTRRRLVLLCSLRKSLLHCLN